LNKLIAEKALPVRTEKPVSSDAEKSAPKNRRRASSKQEVEDLIRNYDLEPLLDMAARTSAF